MKFLLVTGELAANYVRRYAEASGIDFDLSVVPFPVAALLTPSMVIEHLKGRDLSRFDAIILPGMFRGSGRDVERVLGIPTFKGPRDASDLPEVMKEVERGLVLSPDIPACDLLQNRRKKSVEEEFREAERNALSRLGEGEYLRLRNLLISKDLPMRVMAEIVDAPKLSINQIKRIAKYYEESGADIIDIGMVAGRDDSEKIPEIISAVRSVTDLPLSIDSLSPKEIETAIQHGVDMIVSLERSSIEVLSDIARDKICVIIPYDYSSRYFPSDPLERVRAMEENINLAKRVGIKYVMADLIAHPLQSPGFLKSLIAFYEFARRNPEIQLFVGIGNVSELIDADSQGVNALLVGLASELGASVLLTTEASDKTRGSVWEVAQAVKMAYLAKVKGIFPKDLGMDLLILKEKRRKEFRYELDDREIIEASSPERIRYDKAGFFRIWIDQDERCIYAMHFRWENSEEPDAVIRGRKARDIYFEALRRGLVADPTHAAYLGKELEKAEIALKLRKSYVQDAPLFPWLPY